MKLQVFGFAIIMAAAVGGVDYSMQARETDQSMGVGGYIDSVTNRYHAVVEAQALKGRQKQEVKIHLPEAPEGWLRREWVEAHTAQIEIDSSQMSSWEKRKLAANELSIMVGGMLATNISLAARTQRNEVWVYEKGDEVIALRVAFSKVGASKRFPGVDKKIDALNGLEMDTSAYFETVQGVVFAQVWPNVALPTPVTYRGFSARMGNNVMIGVRASATDASVLVLLEQVNYDGLNGMLDQALVGVGSQAGDVVSAQQLALIEKMNDQKEVAVAEDVAAVEASEVSEIVVVAEEKPDPSAARKFESGFDTVRKMPGQKCDRKTGNAFCSGLTN